MRCLVFMSCLALGLLADAAHAHDVDVTGVARVFLDETGQGQYRLSVVDRQVPPLYDANAVIPGRCQLDASDYYSLRFTCTPALQQDDRLLLPWRLEGAVVLARWQSGDEASIYIRGNGVDIPVSLADLKAGTGSLPNLAGTYLVSGAEHILFGFDHLLFVLGLLLLIRGAWPLVKTVTAFTVAHSITLGLAVLGFVHVPGPPVEALIALSVVLLAREILMGQRGEASLVHRQPWVIAFVFGLVHGLGFAGALGELGLRQTDIPLALLFFNLGVEAGQLGFVLAVVAAHHCLAKPLARWSWPLRSSLAYGLGGVATYWLIQRLPGLLPV